MVYTGRPQTADDLRQLSKQEDLAELKEDRLIEKIYNPKQKFIQKDCVRVLAQLPLKKKQAASSKMSQPMRRAEGEKS